MRDWGLGALGLGRNGSSQPVNTFQSLVGVL